MKGKALREALRRRNLESGSGALEPEPEREVELALIQSENVQQPSTKRADKNKNKNNNHKLKKLKDLAGILLEREAAISADQADGDRQYETAATTTGGASGGGGAGVSDDDGATPTSLAGAPLVPAAGLVHSGTPSPPRDEAAAAAARSLVVGASMVSLVAQPIRRTDKMRHGARHVVGQLHEGELFVSHCITNDEFCINDEELCTRAGDFLLKNPDFLLRNDDFEGELFVIVAVHDLGGYTLALTVLEIRSDDLATSDGSRYLKKS